MSGEPAKERLETSQDATAESTKKVIGTSMWRKRKSLERAQKGMPSTKPSVHAGDLDYIFEEDLSTSILAKRSSHKRPQLFSRVVKPIDNAKVLDDTLNEDVSPPKSVDKQKSEHKVQDPDEDLSFAPTPYGDRTQKRNDNKPKKTRNTVGIINYGVYASLEKDKRNSI